MMFATFDVLVWQHQEWVVGYNGVVDECRLLMQKFKHVCHSILRMYSNFRFICTKHPVCSKNVCTTVHLPVYRKAGSLKLLHYQPTLIHNSFLMLWDQEIKCTNIISQPPLPEINSNLQVPKNTINVRYKWIDLLESLGELSHTHRVLK